MRFWYAGGHETAEGTKIKFQALGPFLVGFKIFIYEYFTELSRGAVCFVI